MDQFVLFEFETEGGEGAVSGDPEAYLVMSIQIFINKKINDSGIFNTEILINNEILLDYEILINNDIFIKKY